MAFMCDSSRHQRRLTTFNVIDGISCKALNIDMAVSLPADRMSRYLNKLAEYHVYPVKIRVDNQAEFTGKKFIDWAKSHVITLSH